MRIDNGPLLDLIRDGHVMGFAASKGVPRVPILRKGWEGTVRDPKGSQQLPQTYDFSLETPVDFDTIRKKKESERFILVVRDDDLEVIMGAARRSA